MKQILFFLTCFVFLFTSQTYAQGTLSFQGVIRNSDGTAVDNGKYSMVFKLYETDAGGTAIWEETQDDVTVTGGIYSALLGEVVPLDAPFTATYYLGVAVDGGAEIVPRIRLTSSPYALALLGNSNVFGSDGSVGIGTLDPMEALHVVGNVKIEGSLTASGGLGFDLSSLTEDINTTGKITLDDGLHVPGGEEELRIIRGRINSNGAILLGSGFTITKSSSNYTVTYDDPFSNDPSVVASIYNMYEALRNFVQVKSGSNNTKTIFNTRHLSNNADAAFDFIAVGPR